jgi:hypothetical protein
MTLSCADARPRLTPLLDGELQGEDAGAVQRHIERCAECTRVWSDCLALRAAVTAAPPDETDDLWDAMSARIAGGDRSSLLLTEMRLLHDELRLLQAEVAELKRELILRPPLPDRRGTPLSFPDTPRQTPTRFRLV